MRVSERKSAAIARMLVRAIKAIESFNDDPEMIFEDAKIYSSKESNGVREAINKIAVSYGCE